ncbi:hypothetical protein CVT25_006540 [Psilocybe cyanescens]|uniref:Uncharacterized protein n=1 Tax=Psilocybe cyanescens TaxID=93625 RepID=A0A409X3P4_PSICY|nr:hypothetical protein CVT25_006540 [Psilocybe cyanescens]
MVFTISVFQFLAVSGSTLTMNLSMYLEGGFTREAPSRSNRSILAVNAATVVLKSSNLANVSDETVNFYVCFAEQVPSVMMAPRQVLKVLIRRVI